MTEGAAQKFDMKAAKAALVESEIGEISYQLRRACDRIEALEAVAEAAVIIAQEFLNVRPGLVGDYPGEMRLVDALKSCGYPGDGE